jgi:hypothetical protein
VRSEVIQQHTAGKEFKGTKMVATEIVELQVNGEKRKITVRPSDTLLDA